MEKKGMLSCLAAMLIADILLFGICFGAEYINNISAGIKAYEVTLMPQKKSEQIQANAAERSWLPQMIDINKDCEWKLLNKNTGITVFQAAYAYYKTQYSFYCELRSDGTLDVYYKLRPNGVGGGQPRESSIYFLTDSGEDKLYHSTLTLDEDIKRELLQKACEVRAAGVKCPLGKQITVFDGSYQTIYYKNRFYSLNYDPDNGLYEENVHIREFMDILRKQLEKTVFSAV